MPSLDDLVGDVLGANFEPPPRTDKDHAIARQLTDTIVAKLREKGINASRADDVRAVPKDALVLELQELRATVASHRVDVGGISIHH